MIGPGTGIAPMRALLQERSYQKKALGLPVGTNILYFGCRKRNEDYLYEDELKTFQMEGVLDKLYVAFSREQTEKVYVQDLLLQNTKETWSLIDQDGASIYVCGGVKMGHDVSEALKSICEIEGGMSEDEARHYLSALASNHRFVQELWA
jgi:NADPH-ferrihemoprotein reductase